MSVAERPHVFMAARYCPEASRLPRSSAGFFVNVLLPSGRIPSCRGGPFSRTSLPSSRNESPSLSRHNLHFRRRVSIVTSRRWPFTASTFCPFFATPRAAFASVMVFTFFFPFHPFWNLVGPPLSRRGSSGQSHFSPIFHPRACLY